MGVHSSPEEAGPRGPGSLSLSVTCDGVFCDGVDKGVLLSREMGRVESSFPPFCLFKGMVVCYNLFVIPLGLGMRHIPEACSVMSNMQQKPWNYVKRTTQPSPVVGNDSVTAWLGPRQAHHGAGVWSSEKK